MAESNPKKIQVICEMCKTGKSIKEIADHFCCSTGYISRILTNNGIHHRSELPSDEDIITHYKENLSSYKTAEKFHINQKSVLKILHRNNVATTGIQNYRKSAERYPREIQEEIKNLYESGVSAPKLKEIYGGSLESIYQAIRRIGGIIRQPRGKNSTPISPEEINKICEFYKSGMSQTEIGNKLNRDQTTISKILINNGIRCIKREIHSQYKGGKIIHEDGYVYVWIESEDPMASMRIQKGYVLEHRLVMARTLGRPLLKSETVHHINGNKQDNKPENLQLRVGKHGKGQSMICAACNSTNILENEFLYCGNCKSTKLKFSSL